MATEAQLQHLYHRLQETLGLEGASTMIDLVSPFARHELATKADMAELRADLGEVKAELKADMGELRADMGELRADLLRSFASWLFASQAVLVAIVGLIVSLG